MTPNAPIPTPSPFAATVRTYRPPVPMAPTDLKLNSNEGMLLAEDWLAILSDLPGESISGYPSSASLEARIAETFGLDASQVLAGTGGDDVVERSLRAYLCPGRSVLLNDPSFVMLERYAAMAGGTSVTVPWIEGSLPVGDMLSAVDDTTAMIVVVSPNNPTGLTATAGDLHRLREGAPAAMLLVDLAYGEFADEDLTHEALTIPNTIVIRSFSKAWGLAGLRVGWAAGPADVIEQLRAVGHPYPVTGPSSAIVSHMLNHGLPRVDAFVSRVRRHRQVLMDTLASCGVDALPSQGNFVLARFADALWVLDGLAGMGIAVRAFPEAPVLADRLRITVPGDEGHLQRLCHALEIVLMPETIIIDPDLTNAEELPAQLAEWRLGQARVGSPAAENQTGTRCWHVASTIDAIRAARKAGMLPLAIGGDVDPRDLLLAGAGRVLTNVNELRTLLP